MANNGVRTSDFPSSPYMDDFFGNVNGSTALITAEALVTLISARLGPAYASRTSLYADVKWIEGSVASVFGDVGAKNGVYLKNGKYGVGNWTRLGDLPQSSLSNAALALKADVTALDDERQARIAGDDAQTEGSYFGGAFDASSGAFPAVRQQGGAIQNGDWFEVPEGAEGTVDGTAYLAGQRIKALVDAPSTTTFAGNWFASATLSILAPITDRVVDLENRVDARRDAATALAGSRMPKGFVWFMDGRPYQSNPDTPLALSVTSDLGVEGVDSFGGVLYLDQVGLIADAVTGGSGFLVAGLDKSADLQRAFDIAAAQKLEVRGTPNSKIYISTDVTAWGVRLIDMGGVDIVSDNNSQLTFGGFSTSGGYPVWRIGNVTNGDNLFSADVPAVAPLRIFGAKRGELHLGSTNCLELYADNRVVGGNSTAYMKIYGNGIRRCDRLTDAADSTFSWVTANEFLTGDVIEIQCLGKTYPHNDNLWIDSTLEGTYVSMTFDYAQNNRVIRARLESAEGDVICRNNSYGNVVEGDSTSSGAIRGLYVNPLTLVQDSTSRGNMLTMEAVTRSQKTVVFNLSASSIILSNDIGSCSNEVATGKFHAPMGKPTLVPDLFGFSTTSFDVIAMSEFIPVQVGDAFGFDVEADDTSANLCRTFIYCYDKDMKPLTSQGSGGAFVNMPGLPLAVRDGRGYYGQSTNVSTEEVSKLIGSVERSEVAFLQLAVVGYGAGFWRHCTGFVFGQQLGWERQSQSRAKQHVPSLIGVPTKGYAPEGFQVLDPTNGTTHIVSYAYETFVNGAVSSGTSVTVFETAAVAVGDVVGVVVNNLTTHWTSVAAVSGNNVTLANGPPRTIPDNARIVFNRWATV